MFLEASVAKCIFPHWRQNLSRYCSFLCLCAWICCSYNPHSYNDKHSINLPNGNMKLIIHIENFELPWKKTSFRVWEPKNIQHEEIIMFSSTPLFKIGSWNWVPPNILRKLWKHFTWHECAANLSWCVIKRNASSCVVGQTNFQR
jgi:hypothetical protein